MTEDTSPENLQKFLLSKDPAIRLMGTEEDILEYLNTNSDEPECPNCWDGSKVKGPDDYGEYWCTNSDCDEENYFTKIPTELKELLSKLKQYL